MHIVIGILAWNEEASIGKTIESLGEQTLFDQAKAESSTVEVIVVPNACTDRTAQIAENALGKFIIPHAAALARVEVLAEGGKSNAWNELIHRLAPADTDFFILMDADIRLLTADTLEKMWQTLRRDGKAQISTDTPVKHVALKEKPTLMERFLIGAGSMTKSAPGQLTGQLYCGRGDCLRSITIPKGLIVEDGFIKQMVCTAGFSQPSDASLIVRTEGASHVFECYTRLGDIWNHQIRQAVGHTLYTYFTGWMKAQWEERPINDALKQQCRANPDWFGEAARNEIRKRGFWVMDKSSFWVRWRRAQAARGAQKLKFIAIATLATPFDCLVFFVSNERLRKGRVKSIWKDTRTSNL